MGTKRCPLCAEEIQAAAVKCKHCGAMLNRPDPQFISKVRIVRGVALMAVWGAVLLAVVMVVGRACQRSPLTDEQREKNRSALEALQESGRRSAAFRQECAARLPVRNILETEEQKRLRDEAIDLCVRRRLNGRP